MDIKNLPPGDPTLIENIVNQLKSQGIFDEFRRDCLADVDTKPAYQNLQHRVEAYADDYLAATQWRPDLNKNQMRDVLRKKINDSGLLTKGVDRIIDQIVNPKIIQIILPKITEIVHKLLGIETGLPPNSDSPGVSGDISHSSDSHKDVSTDFDGSHIPETPDSNTGSSADQSANDGRWNAADDSMETNTASDKSSESLVDIPQDVAIVVTMVESEDFEKKISSDVSFSPASLVKEQEHKKDTDPKKDRSSKDDTKSCNLIKSTESEKVKDDHGCKTGTDDSKTKVKLSKKADTKHDGKGKSLTVERPKSSENKPKPEKVTRKDHSPAMVKTPEGKVSKTEVSKGSSSENKDKRNSADKKTSIMKSADGLAKSKNEDRKAKSETSARPDDGVPLSKKPPELKDKCDSKSQKFFKKTKSFDEKDEHTSKSDKHKVEKGKEDASKPKSGVSSSGVKADKRRDEKVKSFVSGEGGKCKGLEVSKSTESKFRVDKCKTPEAKKHEDGTRQQKSAEKIEKVSDAKCRTPEKNKCGDSQMKYDDGRGEKSKSFDKKLHSGSHTMRKESDKSKPEKSGSSSSKLQSPVKSMPPNRDEKPKAKKETDGDHAKFKLDEKASSHSDREKSHNKEDRHTIVPNFSKMTSPRKDSEKMDCGKACLTKRKVLDAGLTTVKDDSCSAKQAKHGMSDLCLNSAVTATSFTLTALEEKEPDLERTEDLDQKNDVLSDVTVSSVHTSDLSDYDDRITLTESEADRVENSPNKKQFPVMTHNQESKPSQYEFIPVSRSPEAPKPKLKFEKPTTQSKQREKSTKVEKVDQEPRRELRRQRKLNPRYASDDFKSIFNTGKDKYHYVHNFDYSTEDTNRNTGNETLEIHHKRGRRSTGHSNTTDETELPGSPISDASELSEMGRSRRSGKGKCSPSESSDGDHSMKGPRSATPDVVKAAESQSKSTSKDSSSKRSRHDRSPQTDMIRNESSSRRDSKAESLHESATNNRKPYRFENQRYDSTDLYKPRPVFSFNRRRGASPTKPVASLNTNYESWGKVFQQLDSDISPRHKHDKYREAQVTRSHHHKQSTDTPPATRGNKRPVEQAQYSSMSKRRR